MRDPHSIIRTVRLSEKGTILSEKFNQYIFEVSTNANKIEIKKAIEKLFGKKVLRVNTQNCLGKKNVREQPLLVGAPIGKKPS